jgi:hypothetical protein
VQHSPCFDKCFRIFKRSESDDTVETIIMMLAAFPLGVRLLTFPFAWMRVKVKETLQFLSNRLKCRNPIGPDLGCNFVFDTSWPPKHGLTMRMICARGTIALPQLCATLTEDSPALVVTRSDASQDTGYCCGCASIAIFGPAGLLCHLMQPVMYFIVLWYYSAHSEMSNLQFSLGFLLLILRELVYTSAIVACLLVNPTIFSVDVVGSVCDSLDQPIPAQRGRASVEPKLGSRESQWKVGKRFLAWFVFAPESILVHSLVTAMLHDERETEDATEVEAIKRRHEKRIQNFGVQQTDMSPDPPETSTSSRVAAIEKQLRETVEIMHHNIGMIIARGEAVEDLDAKVLQGRRLSEEFATGAKRVKKSITSHPCLNCGMPAIFVELLCAILTIAANIVCVAALLSFCFLGTLNGHAYALFVSYAQVAPAGLLVLFCVVTRGKLCRRNMPGYDNVIATYMNELDNKTTEQLHTELQQLQGRCAVDASQEVPADDDRWTLRRKILELKLCEEREKMKTRSSKAPVQYSIISQRNSADGKVRLVVQERPLHAVMLDALHRVSVDHFTLEDERSRTRRELQQLERGVQWKPYGTFFASDEDDCESVETRSQDFEFQLYLCKTLEEQIFRRVIPLEVPVTLLTEGIATEEEQKRIRKLIFNIIRDYFESCDIKMTRNTPLVILIDSASAPKCWHTTATRLCQFSPCCTGRHVGDPNWSKFWSTLFERAKQQTVSELNQSIEKPPLILAQHDKLEPQPEDDYQRPTTSHAELSPTTSQSDMYKMRVMRGSGPHKDASSALFLYAELDFQHTVLPNEMARDMGTQMTVMMFSDRHSRSSPIWKVKNKHCIFWIGPPPDESLKPEDSRQISRSKKKKRRSSRWSRTTRKIDKVWDISTEIEANDDLSTEIGANKTDTHANLQKMLTTYPRCRCFALGVSRLDDSTRKCTSVWLIVANNVECKTLWVNEARRRATRE